MNPTDERWLVAVCAGRWQWHGIDAARAAGLKVLALDGDAQAGGFAHADLAITVDVRDPAAVVAAVRASGIVPAGAISFCSEAGMLAAAALREHFNLPGARADALVPLLRKDRQRALWTAAGVPCPAWQVARSAAEAEAARQHIGGTCIVKPVDSAGSRGVTVLAPGDDGEAAFAHAQAQSLCGTVIVEAFIVGTEHTVETFSHRGRCHVLAITAKKKVPGTHDTVASELASADLPAADLQAIGATCVRALAALGHSDGPGHTEMLRTAGGELFMVESAGRGGGFMVAEGIVPRVSGFDLATACAMQAVGLEPLEPPLQAHRAAVLRFVPSRRGRVVRIDGFGPNDEVPGVYAEPLVAIGQQVGRAASDGDRMALILASADTLTDALAAADRKEARIHVEMSAELG